MKKSTKQNLIGVMVVLLLMTAFGSYTVSKFLAFQHRRKEVVLQGDLWAMRKAIEFYTSDKGEAPKSLEDLVTNKYLREIPADPFTGSNKTWIVQKRSATTGQTPETGVADVHSSASGADRDGKPYREY